MPKVGQIYQYRNNETMVVTYADETNVHVVFTDGYVIQFDDEYRLPACKLLAEYSTWQEAVNAPEFKDNQ